MPYLCDVQCCENPGGRGQAVCWMVDRPGLRENEMTLDEAIDMGPIAETDSPLWQRVCPACIDSYLDLENEFDWWWRAPVEWQGEPLEEGDDGYVFAAPAAEEEDPVAPAAEEECDDDGERELEAFYAAGGQAEIDAYFASRRPALAPGEPDYTNMEALD